MTSTLLRSALTPFLLTPWLCAGTTPHLQGHGTVIAATAAPQAPAAAPAPATKVDRKRGNVFKDEIDQLIDAVCKAANHGTGKGAGLGGTSVLHTAKVLAAMGHCHRHYHVSDGPVVRPSLDQLTRARQADGSYGDPETTAWVIAAFSAIDPDGRRDEIAQARTWLQRQNADVPTFDAAVSAVLSEVRSDAFPQHLAKDPAALAKSLFAEPSKLDIAAASDALVRLVACQTANRRLDKAQNPVTSAWSPAQEKAFQWLLAQQKDGVFFVKMGDKQFPDPAFTGFGIMALQSKPSASRSKAEQAVIDQGLAWLLQSQNEDGSWGKQVPNYTTCVVVGALTRQDNPAAKAALEKAQKCILRYQNAESSGYGKSDRDYGSIGYGNAQRGDLSNLHFSLDALRATGLPANDEAFAKAIVFLQRTQNLKGVNDFKGKVPDPEQDGKIIDATSGDDGGAAYYPGNSAAGYVVLPDGKSAPRSYGSMTYALLKSYTLCGIPGDDPRVQAAVKWIQDNWTLAENPGADPALGEKVKFQGLFYYYMVLAQALAAAKVDTVTTTDKDGKPVAVDWRKALRAHLEGMQAADGTWVNGKNDRWWEGMQMLCTCYAMAALEKCQ